MTTHYPSYKKGEIVKCVDAVGCHYALTEGNYYTVTKDSPGGQITTDDDNGNEFNPYKSRFIMTVPLHVTTYTPGMIVVCAFQANSKAVTEGTIYRVMSLSPSGKPWLQAQGTDTPVLLQSNKVVMKKLLTAPTPMPAPKPPNQPPKPVAKKAATKKPTKYHVSYDHPLVKEADPELEKLLAEEEEIEKQHAAHAALAADFGKSSIDFDTLFKKIVGDDSYKVPVQQVAKNTEVPYKQIGFKQDNYIRFLLKGLAGMFTINIITADGTTWEDLAVLEPQPNVNINLEREFGKNGSFNGNYDTIIISYESIRAIWIP